MEARPVACLNPVLPAARKVDEFLQRANAHYFGHGCSACNGGGYKQRMTQDDFVKKAIEVHDGKYDYSLVTYKKLKTKVDIICPVHGVFSQPP